MTEPNTAAKATDGAGYRQGIRITIWCIIGNFVLSALKLLAGIFGRSQAMVSDALHSASDIVATSVVLVSIRIAGKPVDKEHPYGHGRAESIAAAFVGVTLIFAAVMILKGIIESIAAHTVASPNSLALAAAALSIAVKEAMYRVTIAAGRRIGSESIVADAWHHRSDAFSSIGTFVGILGSMAGKWLNIGFLQYLDPIAGAAVACLIFKVAYDIIKPAVRRLMDTAPGDGKLAEIQKIAAETMGVESAPRIKGRYIGQRLLIDMEIEVGAGLTVEAGHTIAEQARRNVMDAFNEVGEVFIHVEPSAAPDTDGGPPM
jgi:cation diffusion facilitator family transporter